MDSDASFSLINVPYIDYVLTCPLVRIVTRWYVPCSRLRVNADSSGHVPRHAHARCRSGLLVVSQQPRVRRRHVPNFRRGAGIGLRTRSGSFHGALCPCVLSIAREAASASGSFNEALIHSHGATCVRDAHTRMMIFVACRRCSSACGLCFPSFGFSGQLG